MTEKNWKQVSVSGYNDELSITATFTITYCDKCFYHRGVIRSYNIGKFPKLFLLSANSKCCSHTPDPLKHLVVIIVTYVFEEQTYFMSWIWMLVCYQNHSWSAVTEQWRVQILKTFYEGNYVDDIEIEVK